MSKRIDKKPTQKDVIRAVQSHFNISKRQILEGVPHQGNKPVIHRHVAIWVLRYDAELLLDDIAVLLNRSRTTIIRALNWMAAQPSQSDNIFYRELTAVRRTMRKQVVK